MKKRSFMTEATCVALALGMAGLLVACAAGRLFSKHEEVLPVRSTNATTLVIVTNYVTNLVYEVDPGVKQALKTGSEIADAVPGPWSAIAKGVLGIVGVGLAWIARVKSRQAALVPALIEGVEAAANNKDVKQMIQKVALSRNLEPRLRAQVRRLTGPK